MKKSNESRLDAVYGVRVTREDGRRAGEQLRSCERMSWTEEQLKVMEKVRLQGIYEGLTDRDYGKKSKAELVREILSESERVKSERKETRETSKEEKAMTRRLTTEQLIEALKEARNHDERLELLRNAGIGQLRKIGKIEMMAQFGIGWTVEKLSLRIDSEISSARRKEQKGCNGL